MRLTLILLYTLPIHTPSFIITLEYCPTPERALDFDEYGKVACPILNTIGHREIVVCSS